MTEDIIAERVGSLGRIRLNRARAMNALTLAMVRAIDAALDDFSADPAVAVVLLSGEGERGFCAGGDLRSLYESRDLDLPEAFWREEYRLNARIARFTKPVVALMDGITMGGGVGLSAHARHRVVTERSRIAMPETGIGFIPDVGATWLLPRAPGEIGTYLGLTGTTVGAADAMACGLADRLVPVALLPWLIDALAAIAAASSGAAVQDLIETVCQAPEPAPLIERRASIDRFFRFDRVEEILAALAADPTDFARDTLAMLRAKSPTALVVTLRLLRLGRAAPMLEACLNNEFPAALAMLADGDFREGIRAAIIDKDKTPRWSPADLSRVDQDRIEHWCAAHGAAPVFPPVAAPEPARL